MYLHTNKLEALKKKCKHVTPTALGLSDPDESHITIGEYSESGISFKYYLPKYTFHIGPVMDSGKELWESKRDGEKCELVEAYSKGSSILVYLKVNIYSRVGLKYFERSTNEWK